jgi:hypothetical protein
MTDIGVGPTGATTGITMSPGGLSPDALLAYCQMQLNDLDGEISDQMNLQQKQLAERSTLEKAQSLLSNAGPDGPQNGDEMQALVDKMQTLIDGVQDDPSLQSMLQQKLSDMTRKYNFTPARPAAQALEINPITGEPLLDTDGKPVEREEQGVPAQLQTAPDDTSWQATLSDFGGLSDQIKSESDIGMLTLQDLVSQREQAVQLATGIMGKEDQTLEGESKAIGQ